MPDWVLCKQKRWVLSRFIYVFKTRNKGTMVESFASRARMLIDETDLALLRALDAKNPKSAAELADSLTDNQREFAVDEVSLRLEQLASIAVVFSQSGGDPHIWRSLEYMQRQRPFIDFVEITNHCPSRCIMCRAAQGFMDRTRGFMRISLFERILALIGPRPHLKPLILHNAGEPLL
ncbi:MAG: hypothetical protein D3910_10970, partial [Candidatus Electrothrix sp. ATG2]|nr:hypothetical protein [Candidatus Electrothrix sp. ATG2]